MKVATILPIPHLDLEARGDFHLCLAHLLGYAEYRRFFAERVSEGKFVSLDNGAAENGVPYPMSKLSDFAQELGVNELVLPDTLYSMGKTLTEGERAISSWYGTARLMAVPQGNSPTEWLACLSEMLFWPIKAIGISRFICRYFPSRLEALKEATRLIRSPMEIHLLGFFGDFEELHRIEEAFPGRIRSTDSGAAAIYARAGMRMRDRLPKPEVELGFKSKLQDMELLKDNITFWKSLIPGRSE